MPDIAATKAPVTLPVGHGSAEVKPVVRPELFSGQYAGTGPGAAEAFWERAWCSVLTHLVALVVLVVVLEYAPVRSTTSSPMSTIPFHGIVWLNQPGPGGGGGGGGNRMQAPPRKAELPGKDEMTVPVTRPEPQPIPQLTPTDTPSSLAFDIPAKTTADASLTVPGSIDGLASSLSQGPGSGGGLGTGAGTGIGPGTGSGLGLGHDGGTGGDGHRPGSGIENPRVLLDVKPQYTADGVRAQIQGSVVLECVVLPDGTVGQVSVIKSLDPVFGLDQEAIKAARQWRFVPGKKQGRPVPVFVNITLDFNLR